MDGSSKTKKSPPGDAASKVGRMTVIGCLRILLNDADPQLTCPPLGSSSITRVCKFEIGSLGGRSGQAQVAEPSRLHEVIQAVMGWMDYQQAEKRA